MSTTVKLRTGDALLVVDVQRDFLPGGALAVPCGERVIGPINDYLRLFGERGLPAFATRDWHPPNHCSFVEQGGPWPAHCVRETPGAQFAPELRLSADVQVVSKATEPEREGYSPFEVEDFEQRLRDQGIGRLFVAGLTAEYCVLATARDAVARGFEVFLLGDAIGAIEAQPGDGRRAIDEMIRLGAVEVCWEDVAKD